MISNIILRNLPLYSGEKIHENIEHSKILIKETDSALKILCEKRGCVKDEPTSGDTAPIQLLREHKDICSNKLQSENNAKYVRLEDLLITLEHFQQNKEEW